MEKKASINRIYDGLNYDLFNRTEKVETFDCHIQINRYDAKNLCHKMEEARKLVQFIFCGKEVVMEETDTNRISHIRGYELIASDAESARMYYHYASDETVENRSRFNGQQYAPISQQYYLRARYYNPVISENNGVIKGISQNMVKEIFGNHAIIVSGRKANFTYVEENI